MLTNLRCRDYAALRPDTPQWLNLRGFLFSGRYDVFANEDPESGFIVRSQDLPVAVAAGQPERSVVHSAVSTETGDVGDWHMLAPPESVEAVGSALTAWTRRGATLNTRARNARYDDPRLSPKIEVRLATKGWEAAEIDLKHLPDGMRREYETDLVRGCPLASALDRGQAVAFCYAVVTTGSLWDVSVYTRASHRRQGLASACFVTLARHLDKRSLQPVWGTLDRDEPSMQLAAKLGFRPSARMMSFVRK